MPVHAGDAAEEARDKVTTNGPCTSLCAVSIPETTQNASSSCCCSRTSRNTQPPAASASRRMRRERPVMPALGRHEFQGDAVVAVALARGLGAVVEDMALVPFAARAVVFRARQDELEVGLGLEAARDEREEAGPARA